MGCQVDSYQALAANFDLLSIIMHPDMKNRIESILSAKCNLTSEDLILIGVSGGPDSICLLHLMHHLGLRIVVAHLNHGIRPESTAEADFVHDFTKSLGLQLITGTADVIGEAASSKKSLEETARNARYGFLFRVAHEVNARAVAVGHHADDQVETILMHLLRGSSLAGLRGMSFLSLPNEWSETIPLVRPLLSTWREEIDRYIKENTLGFKMDTSNLDRTYYRNRLRHELIPYLETYNPKIRKLIWQTGYTLQDDYALVAAEIERNWEACLSQQGRAYIKFHLSRVRSLPAGMQRHLLRAAVSALRPDMRDITYDLLVRAQDFIQSHPESGQMELTAGLCLLVEGDALILVDQEDQSVFDDPLRLASTQPIEIEIPGSLSLSSSWELRAELMPADVELISRLSKNPDPYQGWFDVERLPTPLYVRSRKTGDRFMPLGMDGRSTKVSDFMVNVKIPRRLRDGWPLVVMKETIVWIPGYQVAELYRVTPDTRKVLHLIVKRKDK